MSFGTNICEEKQRKLTVNICSETGNEGFMSKTVTLTSQRAVGALDSQQKAQWFQKRP